MTLAVALFAWSLFLSVLLLAMMAGVLAPRPILLVAVLGSGFSALIALIVSFGAAL